MSKQKKSADHRLDSLVDGIVRLSSGDLKTRIDTSKNRDEIDAVITGFNLLAAELEIAQQELEERVESRTAMLHEAHIAMERMAMTDALTGLANRVAFMRALEETLDEANQGAAPPALLLLDLDSFKAVNDSLGHAAGDHVLVTVAERLRRVVRETDTVARQGGDEFAILIPHSTPAHAQRVASGVLNALNEPIELAEMQVFPKASIGLHIARPGTTAENLLLEADTAMYEAKASGRSNVRIFEPIMLHARQMRNTLTSELRVAIAEDQLILHYQPVVHLATGRIQGVEALVRWNHPTRGLVMPDEFIPLAEESGSIVELGRWVLMTAAKQMREWQNQLSLANDFKVGINLSAVELRRIDLVEDVRNVLRATGLEPANLVLEITETALVTRNEVDRYALTGIKKLGVGIEIDDFGTGYSSISYLRELPVNMVKIDRSLMGQVATCPRQQEFVAAILQLVRACELEAIFEGIETWEQAEQLKRLGCSSGQGYYFSRPMAEPEMTALLTRTARNGGSSENISLASWMADEAMKFDASLTSAK
ncbi:putative bifunctional diguanylate cyclase/phosphodiesterase [Arthrobacter sp. H14]|uniref:putative bifunctional diguanylate cyclase/phosphodiesterase n=1 Tax=Arthrobacter sp. H14 TaxID=1312959 RepID=UPI0004AC8A8A|nr:EAL domain-containing protein [Arthrobacter sp. H14]